MNSFSVLQTLSYWQFTWINYYITLRARWWVALIFATFFILANIGNFSASFISTEGAVGILIGVVAVILVVYPLIIMLSSLIRYLTMRSQFQNVLYEFNETGMKVRNRQSAFAIKDNLGSDEQTGEFREFLGRYCPSGKRR